jgi:MerR family redox-sensitive transcriptional activator SoxR
MTTLGIGEVAARSGLRPSALRYYERLGLLPRVARAGGKRRYDATVFEWLSLIALAREAGFTIAEIKRLVKGFTPGTPPAAKWRELASRKLVEVDEMIQRAERMRSVLQIALDCGCFRLEDCSVLLDAAATQGRNPCARV